MVDALLLVAVFACAYIGLGWLALSQDRHWRTVRGGTPASRVVVRLRLGGALWLVCSLLCALQRDAAHFGVPLWVMALVVSGFAVTLTLTWKPRWIGRLLG